MNHEPTHKKGEAVFIYDDPITKKSLEGLALLNKFLGYKGDLEWWEVRFIQDYFIEEEKYQRFISEKETR